jgi:hypothetical protein
MPWKFFVYTWIIIFQWIAMWQHHSLLWYCSVTDIEVLKEASPSFYLINMTTTVATNWCHALTEFLGTASHLIQFPLRSSSMELMLLWPPRSCIHACTIMGDVMCAPLQEDYSNILEYYCTKPQLQLHSCTLTGEGLGFRVLQDIPG